MYLPLFLTLFQTISASGGSTTTATGTAARFGLDIDYALPFDFHAFERGAFSRGFKLSRIALSHAIAPRLAIAPGVVLSSAGVEPAMGLAAFPVHNLTLWANHGLRFHGTAYGVEYLIPIRPRLGLRLSSDCYVRAGIQSCDSHVGVWRRF